MRNAKLLRARRPGAPMLDVRMPDGLEFATDNIDATDAELEVEAAQVRDFLDTMVGSNDNEHPEYDEDPDADGYGWERHALGRIAGA